jgi:hypothetical protein
VSFFLGFISGVVSLTVAIALLAAFAAFYVKALFRGRK